MEENNINNINENIDSVVVPAKKKSKKPVVALVVILVFLAAAAATWFFLFQTKPEDTIIADKIIYGTIYTDANTKNTVSALAVKGDEIVYAGDSEGAEEYKSESTEVLNLREGEAVLAGFNDGHNHASTAWYRKINSAQIPDGASAEECVEIIRKFVEEHPDQEAYKAYGWIDSVFEEGGPTAALLDQIDTDKPIVATASDGHSDWVNSVMLERMNITADTEVPAGGTIERFADGTPTGVFRDNATVLTARALPAETAEEYVDAILGAQEEYAELGYTSYVEALINDKSNPSNSPAMEAYEQLDQEGRLKIYTQASFITTNNDKYLEYVDEAIEARDKTKGGMFEVTEVKVFMDGVVEGKTAYLSEPYLDDSTNYGQSSWKTEEDIEKLSEVVAKANEAGMAVHFHTIGDQALTNAVAAVEKAYEKAGQPVLDARNVVVHLQLVDDAVYEKMAKLNMIADINPWCSKAAGYYEEIEVPILGAERAENEYPNKNFFDNGVHVAAGTDFGASFTYDPVEAYHIYVTRMDKTDDPITLLKEEQRLTSEQALGAMTAGSAFQMHRENSYGTLEVGKKANLVVLNQDLYKIEDSEIMSTDVLKTMSNGEWIYQK